MDFKTHALEEFEEFKAGEIERAWATIRNAIGCPEDEPHKLIGYVRTSGSGGGVATTVAFDVGELKLLWRYGSNGREGGAEVSLEDKLNILHTIRNVTDFGGVLALRAEQRDRPRRQDDDEGEDL